MSAFFLYYRLYGGPSLILLLHQFRDLLSPFQPPGCWKVQQLGYGYLANYKLFHAGLLAQVLSLAVASGRLVRGISLRIIAPWLGWQEYNIADGILVQSSHLIMQLHNSVASAFLYFIIFSLKRKPMI